MPICEFARESCFASHVTNITELTTICGSDRCLPDCEKVSYTFSQHMEPMDQKAMIMLSSEIDQWNEFLEMSLELTRNESSLRLLTTLELLKESFAVVSVEMGSPTLMLRSLRDTKTTFAGQIATLGIVLNTNAELFLSECF